MPRKILISAMKDEASFVLEWIAYHKAIGFDDIMIVANPSNDGMVEILEAMQNTGHIDLIVTQPPKGTSAQDHAAKLINESGYIRYNDYVIFLDADEFLNIKIGDGYVDDLIADMGDSEVQFINWRVFGSNGHTTFPGRFISEVFDKTDPEHVSVSNIKEMRQVKTFYKTSERFPELLIGCPHRPRVEVSATVKPKHVRVPTREYAAPRFGHYKNWVNGSTKRLGALHSIHPSETSCEYFQINHYSVRTLDRFFLKRVRGRGAAAEQAAQNNKRHSVKFFRKFNTNSVTDRSILRFKEATTENIERYMNDSTVRDAFQSSEMCIAQLLEEYRGQINGMIAELNAYDVNTNPETASPNSLLSGRGN